MGDLLIESRLYFSIVYTVRWEECFCIGFHFCCWLVLILARRETILTTGMRWVLVWWQKIFRPVLAHYCTHTFATFIQSEESRTHGVLSSSLYSSVIVIVIIFSSNKLTTWRQLGRWCDRVRFDLTICSIVIDCGMGFAIAWCSVDHFAGGRSFPP